ncbi:MAG: glutamate-5-semialdehyde dehydrogenase [Anaerolineae bacterium]
MLTVEAQVAGEVAEKGVRARAAARRLAFMSARVRNAALHAIADALVARQDEIAEANRRDLATAREMGLSEAMLGRLKLDAKDLRSLADDVRHVAALPDPLGETEMQTLPSGLQVGKRRVPLGVIGVIYESRPNVTIDIAALCIKSGNAAILRGGKEALNSNRILAQVVADAATAAGLPEGTVQLIQSTDRALVREMLEARDFIDLLIPRGGADLHRFAIENAKVPVVTGGIGVVHIYVDQAAKLDDAVEIGFNAKTQKPSACNAADTFLVHRAVAATFLPRLAARLGAAGVELRVDERSLAILGAGPLVKAAGPEDFGYEFLALRASVRVVDSLDEALDHIARYGGHSEAIITEDYSAAMRFLDEVDSAAVFVNASTRFNDGGQFGLGAEVAISTTKLHARGPMGLKELTTYKWIVLGHGDVRP